MEGNNSGNSLAERERVRRVNRSLLEDIALCPDFDIGVFEDELDRMKKRKKLKSRIFKFLESQDLTETDNKEIAEKLFDYISDNDWFDMDNVETPSLFEIT